MSSKTVYGVIGILVIAVVVLTGLVGYLYQQKPQTVTETNSQTITITNTSTYTQIVTTTNTYTYPSSQTQTNQYKIEATAEPISGGGGAMQVTIKVSGPAESILILISDTDGKGVALVPILKIDLLDGVETVQTAIPKEGLYTFIIARQSDANELYRTTIELPGAFTRFEKLEISSAYAYSAILIVINVSNTGSSDATITDVFVNGKPAASFTPAGTLAPALPLPLASGASTTITLTFANPGLVSGVTYDIKIHTASGNDYPKAVVIP